MSQEPCLALTRLKRVCGHLCKSRGGFSMIEAGLLMPIFLFMTFAIVDYGLMMSERSAAAGNISSLTRTIQDNPQISIAELNTLIANTGFGNGNLTAAGNCLCAKSFSTQAQAQSFTADTGCSDAACTAAGRNTGIGTPRFIGVRGEVTYNFITPVHNIFTGNNAQVMRFGKVVPVGVTVCPAGQALTSAGVCAASTITCGAGQFLTASGTCSAAVPVCNQPGKALQFDGANWSCASVAMSLSSSDCYWTGAYSGMQAGKCGWRGQECASGYMIASLEHQNDACDIGFNQHDEAFKIKCCRVQLN
jgi:Flp pilus assembly protein TadG